MKKNIIQTIILVVLVIVTSITMTIHFIHTNNNTYSRAGVVIDSNTIKTNDGNIWKYDTNYNKSSKVKVSFNNKDTQTIFDDEVIKVELR